MAEEENKVKGKQVPSLSSIDLPHPGGVEEEKERWAVTVCAGDGGVDEWCRREGVGVLCVHMTTCWWYSSAK